MARALKLWGSLVGLCLINALLSVRAGIPVWLVMVGFALAVSFVTTNLVLEYG